MIEAHAWNFWVIGPTLMLLGLSVMAAWKLGAAGLIVPAEGSAPMQFNTAVCIFLLGLGSVLGRYSHVLTYIVSLCVAFIASLTLYEYAFDFNFGIDELFHTHEITVKTSHPGRMAPNTALYFLAMAFGIFHLRHMRFAIACSVVIAVVSLKALLGYSLGLDGLYHWGDGVTSLALHTSIAALLSSIGLYIAARRVRAGAVGGF